MSLGGDVEDIYPLSPLQQGVLFHSLAAEQGEHVTQIRWTFDESLQPQAFEQAWRRLIARHAILRSSFYWEDVGEPVQVVHARPEFAIAREDWSALSPEAYGDRVDDYTRREQRESLDLGVAPAMRLSLLKGPRGRHEFVWTVASLLLDGWSMHIVLHELMWLYRASLGSSGGGSRGAPLGRGEPDLPPPRPYRDYIAWVKAQDIGAAERFWRKRLAGFTEPTPLPFRDTALGARGGDESEHAFVLSQAETASLRAFARAQHVTLNTVVLACWALIQSRCSGRDDVVFGTVVAGRPAALAGMESIVGLLINTLPARVRVPAGETIAAWLARIQAEQIEQREFEYSPLVEVQRWSEMPRGRALFDSLLVFENYFVQRGPAESGGGEAEDWEGLAARLGIRAARLRERTNYPLTIIVVPRAELSVKFLYDPRHIGETQVRRLEALWRAALASMVEAPARRVESLSLLSPADRRTLLVEWNDTARPRREPARLHDLFAAQAWRDPERVAIVARDERWTYGFLDGRADEIARALRAAGVGPESRVAVLLERTPELVAAMLGVLKAGGCYVPLDVEYPEQRIERVVVDSSARIVVTHSTLRGRLAGTQATIVCVDALPMAPVGTGATRAARGGELATRASAASLAYVIYTSGSTGRPKGVGIEHASAVAFVRWALDAYSPEELAGVLATTSICFDLSVFELFVPLAAGGRVLLVDDALAVRHARAPEEATLLNTVPSAIAELVRSGGVPESCVLVNLAGEPLARALVAEIHAGSATREVRNLYAPSETTTYSTSATIDRADARAPSPAPSPAPSIGRPIAETRIYVLDGALELVPIGVEGELVIAGSGVARGYLGNPAATAERFLPDPFAGSPGARFYRTGDRGRWRDDGELEFLGRRDHQVKLRGFRIELGEVEAALRAHESAREVVVLRVDDGAGARLVAYAVTATSVSTLELRKFLKRSLPAYMIPGKFVFLDRLPRTTSGKIDRPALAASDAAAGTAPSFVAPSTPTEQLIAEAWRDVLGVERVGIHDTFLDLGGHSILAIRVIDRLQRAGVRVQPKDLLFHTLAQLASAHEATGAG